MSLKQFVLQSIQKDLDSLQHEYQVDLKRITQESKRAITDLEQIYHREVEQEVERQVNLAQFLQKRDHEFASQESFQEKIDQLYQDLIPDILETKFGRNVIQEFLKHADKTTTFTIHGKYHDLLVGLVKQKSTHIKENPSENSLGTITYTKGSTRYEFSLEDVISKAKQKTLSTLIS